MYTKQVKKPVKEKGKNLIKKQCDDNEFLAKCETTDRVPSIVSGDKIHITYNDLKQ